MAHSPIMVKEEKSHQIFVLMAMTGDKNEKGILKVSSASVFVSVNTVNMPYACTRILSAGSRKVN